MSLPLTRPLEILHVLALAAVVGTLPGCVLSDFGTAPTGTADSGQILDASDVNGQLDAATDTSDTGVPQDTSDTARADTAGDTRADTTSGDTSTADVVSSDTDNSDATGFDAISPPDAVSPDASGTDTSGTDTSCGDPCTLEADKGYLCGQQEDDCGKLVQCSCPDSHLCTDEPYCTERPPTEAGVCDDGLDNDGDGHKDCRDPDCSFNDKCWTGFQHVFVTSITTDGSITASVSRTGPTYEGIAAAHILCNKLAKEAGLPGTWKAVLSDSKQPANKRLVVDKPVVNFNRDLVAQPSDFWSSTHLDAVRYDQNRVDLSSQSGASAQVWTGTTVQGETHTYHCNDWTGPSLSGKLLSSLAGEVGRLDARFYRWVRADKSTCDNTHRLYCIDGQVTVGTTQ